MSLKEFVNKLKKKAPLLESSMVDLNVGDNGVDIKEAIRLVLDRDDEYNRQLANIMDKEESFYVSMFDAWVMAKDEYDIKGFVKHFKNNYLTTSRSINGELSKQIQNIFVGQLNREFAMDIAKIRSGEGDVKEIKGAV